MENILKLIVRFYDWTIRTYAEICLFFCGYWTGYFVISNKKVYLLLAIIEAVIAYNEFKERKRNEN